MPRPLYETESDLKSESSYAEKLADRWSSEPIKLPIKYHLDFAMVRDDDIKAWVEIRCRNVNSDTYSSFVFSIEKWKTGIDYHTKTGLPFIMAVRWKDKDMYYTYNPSDEVSFSFMHITKEKWRGDSQDNEPVVEIPIRLFREI